MKLHQVMGVCLALAAAGCAAPIETSNEAGEERIGAAEGAILLSDVASFPAYFGHDNRFSADEDATWLYASFTSHVGKRLHIELGQTPGAERAWVGFNLYRVRADGHLGYAGSAQSWSGAAGLSLRSKGTGAYLVEMTSSRALADLELGLSCDGGGCSPDRQPGELCGGIAGFSCAEGLYCDYGADGACGAGDRGGACAVPPRACNKMYAPVCGCDGQTYGNACMAAAAGVSVAAEGECAAAGGAREGELCGGIAGIACAEGLYCAYAAEASCGESDQSGVCAKRPEACIQVYDPVCGCDGWTYGNACTAASAGVSVRSPGECAAPVARAGESCGGFRRGPSPVCAEGLYCSYRLEDTCGHADAPGTCAEPPEFCTEEYAPVCGCDQQTYPNACVAARSGTSVYKSGPCEADEQG